jgi:NAD(P)H-hydrate repair Nnr-like enzyme with NAD(P)H-hydrate epimerase domain
MLIAGGVVVSAVGGCGDETIDDGKVEDFLRDNAQAPALIESIDCPSDIEVDEGDTFDCQVHTRGGGLEISTMRQIEDERVELAGTRQVRLPEGKDLEIIPENVESLIRSNASEPERIVSVDCPAGVEIEKGATFQCLVRRADGRKEKVTVVQRDELGNVEIEP